MESTALVNELDNLINLPIPEMEFLSKLQNGQYNEKNIDNLTVQNGCKFYTYIPGDCKNMQEWQLKAHLRTNSWMNELNISTGWSRFDNVKEYLKKKFFKVKSSVEVEKVEYDMY